MNNMDNEKMNVYTFQFKRDYPAKKPLGTIEIDENGVTFRWPSHESRGRKEWSRTVSYDLIEKVTCREVNRQHEIGDRLATYLIWLVCTAGVYAFLITDIVLHILGNPVLSLGWDMIFLIGATAYLLPRTLKARRKLKRWSGVVLQIEVRNSDALTAAAFDEDDRENMKKAGEILQHNLSVYNA